MTEAFILEGEEQIREGESRPVAITFPQFSTMSTGGTEVFVNGSTATTDFMSGSTSIVGNVVTAGVVTIPGGTGGLTAVVEVGVTIGGNKYKSGVVYRILRPGSAR